MGWTSARVHTPLRSNHDPWIPAGNSGTIHCIATLKRNLSGSTQTAQSDLRRAMNPKQPPEPVDSNGFHDRGNLRSRNGSYESAIADYSKAIDMGQDFAEAHYNRGASYYEIGNYEEALADLNRAIDLDPKTARYYSQRSLVYLFTDRTDLAEADEEMCEELRNQGLDDGS